MQNNNSEQDGRVRYVPVRLEGDGTENCRYVNNQHLDQGQQDSMDFEPYLPFQYYNPQSQAHQQSQSGRTIQTSQRAPTHTSSIDIDYKPPPPSQNQHGTPKQPSHQPNGPSTGSNDAFSHTNHSSRLSPQNDMRGFNKENRQSPTDRNKSPTTGDSAIEKNSAENDSQEQQPLKPEAVIPLPPPPEQSRPASNNSNGEEKQGQNEEKNTSEKSDKVKQQESGPQGVINATKVEVNRLLQEIANCHETSLKSKEYLRLDELLTLCILKLDDIQSQEWRQQRKEVIILINKCTELLERKINLNRDIQQLSANCS